MSEQADSNLVEHLDRLELSIFDKHQRMTVLAEGVNLETYKRLINLTDKDFKKEMMKRLNGVNLRANGRTVALLQPLKKKEEGHRKQFSFSGK